MSTAEIRSLLCAAAILALTSHAAAAQQAAPGTTEPAVKPSESPATPAPQSLEGLAVFSSDGTKVGEVRSVSKGPGGNVVALLVRTGGFLGFGGRTIAIPGDRFTRKGPNLISVDLDSEQIDHLPEIKD